MAPMQFFKICCEVLPFFNNWEGEGVIPGVGREREGRRKGREREILLPVINGVNFNCSRALEFFIF